METAEWKIVFTKYANAGELDTSERELLTVARQALAKSYAPYSKFQVAAALRTGSGAVISGANQENAAYPMCLCAERVALAAAQSEYPGERIEAMAVVVAYPEKPVGQPATPCGACRQVIVEQEKRQRAPMVVLLQGQSEEVWRFHSGGDLLPLAFTGDLL